MKISFFQKSRVQIEKEARESARELTSFAQAQFKELAKKNLNIPVKLYHL